MGLHPDTRPSLLRRLFRWTLTKLVVVVVAVIAIAAFVTKDLLTQGLQQQVDPPHVLDQMSREPAVRTTPDLAGYGTDGNLMALPGVFVATAAEMATLNERATSEGGQDRYTRLILDKGGVQIYKFAMNLGLEGRRNEQIRIADIKPVILKRVQPMNGTLICSPAAGGGPVEAMDFDLDSRIPQALLHEESGDSQELPYFSKRTITLNRGEVVDTYLTFKTEAYYVEFNLAVDVVYGGQNETITVTNGGKPFKITGYGGGEPFSSVTGLRHYQNAYIVGTGEPAHQIDPASWTSPDSESRVC
jgi:hypothetical protein